MPDAAGAAPAHGDGVALEPRLLRHHRRRAAPAHREPGAAVGPDGGRRDRQRRAVAGADAGHRRPPSGGQPDAAVRGRPVQLRQRRPPGPRRPPDVARRRRPHGHRARPRRAAAAGRRRGWRRSASPSEDRERYLGVIERRLRNGHTGSRWVLSSLNAMRNQGTAGQRLNSLTAAMVSRQRGGVAGGRVDAGQPRRGRPVAPQLRVHRAADDHRPRHVRRGRPGRAGRQPDGLAPHPPGARRGRRAPAGRAGVVPHDPAADGARRGVARRARRSAT